MQYQVVNDDLGRCKTIEIQRSTLRANFTTGVGTPFHVISDLFVRYKGLFLNAMKDLSHLDTPAELSNSRKFQGKKYYYPNLRAAVAFPKIPHAACLTI